MKRGTWAEINLNNIKNNLNVIKNNLNANTKICCVIKADAYGHGASKVAELLEKENVDYFAVARFEEAIELRENGIKLPILCLGYISQNDIEKSILNNITLTVYSYDMANQINLICNNIGIKGKIHLKIDTGMSRLGFIPGDNTISEIEGISKLNNIEIEGIYSHFATADENNKTESYLQLLKFRQVVNKLEKLGIDIKIKHISNTAGILDLKDLDFNMVRLGIGLYGYYPSNDVSSNIKLTPALSLKTKITGIKYLPKGTKVGYGYTYECSEDIKIATLSIGYADGFSRTQKNPKIKIKGVLCDIIGRICMDQCMVKIPSNLNVELEDEVLVIGNEEGVTVEDIASRCETINYEILCSISKRVERHYI